MKFFKDFFQFRNSKQQIFEQEKNKVEKVGGLTEFEKKASKGGKKKLRLDYTEKTEDPIWQGDNYNQVWKPAVLGALKDPETYTKVLDYLKTYNGQDAATVKKIIDNEEKAEKAGKGSLKYAVRKLATDGRIGPFHTIMRKAVERATGEKIEPLEPKQAKLQTPNEEPKTAEVKLVDTRNKEEVEKIEPKKGKLEIPKEEEKKPNLKPVEVPETKPVEEIPQEKEVPQEVAKPEPSGPKSETSDPATGNVGEAEKQQTYFRGEGANMAERLLNAKYPNTVSAKKDSLGNYTMGSDLVVGERTRVRVILKDIGVDRWIYFISEYKGKKGLPVQFYSFQMKAKNDDKEMGVVPRNSGPLTISMVVSTVDLKPKVTTTDEGDFLTEKQCQEFYFKLKDGVKPFADSKWNGPVFSITNRKFDVK